MAGGTGFLGKEDSVTHQEEALPCCTASCAGKSREIRAAGVRGIGACACVCERETPEPGQGGRPINVVP